MFAALLHLWRDIGKMAVLEIEGSPMRAHIVRCTRSQAYFDTATVSHYSVTARTASEAVAEIQRCFRGRQARVEWITTLGE